MSRKESHGAASHGTRLLGSDSRLQRCDRSGTSQRCPIPETDRSVQRIGEMEAALCAITVAESAHGIYRADTSERRKRRRIFLDELKAAVPVYPITDGTAELVG